MSCVKEVQVTPQRVPGAPSSTSPERHIVTTNDVSFRTLFINHPDPISIYDLTTLRCLEVNDAAVKHYGYSRAEFVLMLLTDIYPPADVPLLVSSVALTRAGARGRGKWRHLGRHGRLINTEVTYHRLAFEGHEANMVVVHDITKQRQAEKALAKAEQKYRLMFEKAIVGMYQSALNGHFLSANPAMARMFGFDSPKELMACVANSRSQVYADPLRLEKFEQLLQQQGTVKHFDLQINRKGGGNVWLQTNAHIVHDGSSVVRYEGTFEDVTQRKLLEGQLLKSQQKYRDIVENALVGIFQSTPQGHYLSVNPAMANILGYNSPEDLMASVTDIGRQVYVDSESHEEFNRTAREHKAATNFECQAYRKDGSKIWLCANVRAIFKNGVVVRYEGMIEDMTQRKLLESQLRQSHKMEAVGLLAGGIAHDFNNTLGIIIGYGDLLQMNLPVGDSCRLHAEEITKAGRRAGILIHQLLAFSRKQAISPVILDLNVATKEFEKMMHQLIGEDIAITLKCFPDLGRVKMDPGQVEQILMNLAVNARDAMPQGGRLYLETANIELDATYARQNVDVPPGPYVVLSVSDTGCGMDKETQLHIFEPFFTTKEAGQGTGLGLSTVYGIAKQNAGCIRVYSVRGIGTTFKLYLPRLGDGAKLSSSLKALETIRPGTETVLLVEDDEPLRLLARICLESHGYSVIDAPDAASAIELAEKHRGKIHLLLTDIVMPGMCGRELANLLTARHRVKVLFMSGYNRDLINHRGLLDPDVAFLEKPFSLHSLLTQVSKVVHVQVAAKPPPARPHL